MRNLFASLVVVALMMSLCGRFAPAGEAADVKPVERKIVVFPLIPQDPDESQTWLGQSIRQGLIADLVPVVPGRIDAMDAPVKSMDVALQIARKAGAQYALIGEFETSGSDVRVTGRVFAVDSGRDVAALKATGSDIDTFRIEQALSAQLRQALGLALPTPALAPLAQQQQPANPPPAAPAAGAGGGAVNNAPFVNGIAANGSDFDPSTPWSNAMNGPLDGPYIGPALAYGSGYGYGNRFGRNVPPNSRWNGSYSLGLANSTAGVPLGAFGTVSIAGGGVQNVAGTLGTPTIAGGGTLGSASGGLGMPTIAGGGGNNLYNIVPGSMAATPGDPPDLGPAFSADSTVAARQIPQPRGARPVGIRPTANSSPSRR